MSSVENIRRKLQEDYENLSTDRAEAKKAAEDIIKLLVDHRFVCVTAETQMGKTTICRLIAKKAILNLKDKYLIRLNHKNVIYIENVANNSLADQAKDNFSKLSANVMVLPITKAEKEISYLCHKSPILFMIDESHMGCDLLAKRLNSIFALIEDRNNKEDRILLISATGFSSIYEASSEKSIMNCSASVYVVKPPKSYRGIKHFLSNNQVIDNSFEPCLLSASINQPHLYQQFIDLLSLPEGGLYIIRATANETQATKDLLLSLKDTNNNKILHEENVKIVARSLNDVDQDDLCSWEEIIKTYENYKIRDQKLIVIVRGFLRVGIAMPPEMKEDLIATWDGTSSAVSSVVQALIGRACGYHNNNKAKHFANIKMLKAHNELSNKLIEYSDSDSVNLSDISLAIQNITENYNIPNWDAGLSGTDRKSKKNRKSNRSDETYYHVSGWGAYSFNPEEKLKASSEDVYQLISDFGGNHNEYDDVSTILEIIHRQFDPVRGVVKVRHGRRMSSTKAHKNVVDKISGQYLNKTTFLDPQKSLRRKLEQALTLFEKELPVSFNDLRAQGAGRKPADQLSYIAYVISVYNCSKNDKDNSVISDSMINTFCDTYGIKRANTVILFFKKGDEDVIKNSQLEMELRNIEAQIAVDGNVQRHYIYSN